MKRKITKCTSIDDIRIFLTKGIRVNAYVTYSGYSTFSRVIKIEGNKILCVFDNNWVKKPYMIKVDFKDGEFLAEDYTNETEDGWGKSGKTYLELQEKPKDNNFHDGDCTIYASLSNGCSTDGICTCGYGLRLSRNCDYSEVYSKERKDIEAKLEKVLDEYPLVYNTTTPKDI